MAVIFTNNADSVLSGAITASATTIAINAADAGKFPVPTSEQWFPLTFVDASGNMEIVRATARNGAVITVVRAQENTAAKAFEQGTRVELRLTSAAMAELTYSHLEAAEWKDDDFDRDNVRFAWIDYVARKIRTTNWSGIAAKLLPTIGGILTGTLQGKQAGGDRTDKSKSNISQASFYAPSKGTSYVNMGSDAVSPFSSEAATTGSSFAPIISHRYTHNDGWAGHYTIGVLNRDEASQGGFQILHADLNGASRCIWDFDGRNGNFSAPGNLQSGGSVRAGGASLATDGNVFGSRWNAWGTTDAFLAIEAQIERRARDFADDRRNSSVIDARFAGWIYVEIGVYETETDGTQINSSGYVLTHIRKFGRYRLAVGARQPQVYIPYVGWRAQGAW